MPRDPKRITQVLGLILVEWEKNPDLRLGQLLVNTITAATGQSPTASDVFNFEDDRLIDEFRKSPEKQDG